jgi:uncharacterized membrane protein YgcG
MRNNKGQAEFLVGFMLVLLGIVVLFGLGVIHKPSRKHQVVTQSLQVKKLRPECGGDQCKGGYAYRDTTGDWWYYYWLFSPGQMNPATTNYYTSYGSSLPPGGSWTKSSLAPSQDRVQDEARVDIPESMDNGIPLTQEQIEEEARMAEAQEGAASEAERNPGDVPADARNEGPEPEAPAAEAASVDTGGSMDTSSSSSDSGSSGGDSGGDSGGGGGE